MNLFISVVQSSLTWNEAFYLILGNFIMTGSNFNCSDIFAFVHNKSNHSARIGVFCTTFHLPFSAPFSSTTIFTFVICPPFSPYLFMLKLSFQEAKGTRRDGGRGVYSGKKRRSNQSLKLNGNDSCCASWWKIQERDDKHNVIISALWHKSSS